MSEPIFSLDGKTAWVAGHRGMVGSALVRRLQSEKCSVLTADRDDVDLIRQSEVEGWMNANRPQVVFLAAAKVGGIQANNSYPAQFLYENLMIEANIIHAAFKVGVEKLIFLGSSCIYPKLASQPMGEDALMTGPLEPTNEWYAIAKIAGIRLCQAYRKQYGCDFISAMPTNLYGPGDNYDLNTSHVVPALIKKVVHAHDTHCETVELWGSGEPLREFLHVDDCADAIVFLARHYSDGLHVNVGSGEEVSIRALMETICRLDGITCNIIFNTSKPVGSPRKLLDSSFLRDMGWRPQIPLEEGLARTIACFRAIDA
jgi:GDP-L-fucose synthase